MNATRSFYDDLLRHDFVGAHTALFGRLSSENPVRNLQDRLDMLEAHVGVITLWFTSADLPIGSETSAKARAILLTKNGQKYSIELELEKVNGDWKIVNANPGLIPQP